MEPPNPPSGGTPQFGDGGSLGNIKTSLDRDEAHSILDRLLTSLGQNVEATRGNYDKIINSILTQNFETFSAPGSIAASSLAARPGSWSSWTAAVKLHDYRGPAAHVLSEVQRVRSNIRYPRSLLELEQRIDERQPNMRKFITAVKSWTNTDRSIQWDDTGEVPDLWEPLLFSWSHSKNAVEKGRNEATQRSLVDSMMQLVFYRTRDSDSMEDRYEVLSEIQLALPRPSSATPHFSSNAKADMAVLKLAPQSIYSSIVPTAISHGVSNLGVFESLYYPLDTLMIGAFAVEAKRQSNPSNVGNQVAMDMCSIQHQRRAMGLEDRCIYGATYAGGIFTLFASWWTEPALFYAPVPDSFTWNFIDPVQFIQCLYFLWELRKHMDESFKGDFDSFDVSKSAAVVENKPFWRHFGESKKRGNDGKPESGSKRSKPNESEGQGADDADDVDMMDGADEGPSIPQHYPRPLTIRDIILNLPFIIDELSKVARIEEWKKSVAASENEGTLVHANENNATVGK